MTAGGAAALPIPALLPLPVQETEAEAVLARRGRPSFFSNLNKMSTDLLASQLNLVLVWSISRGIHDIESVSTALIDSKGLDLCACDCQACLLEDVSQGC